MTNIAILGATGSIGTQTLDIIRHQNMNFKLVAFSAHSNFNTTVSIIKEFLPECVAITNPETYSKVREYCIENKIKINILEGMEGLIQISIHPEVDMVVTSVVGMVGLIPTLQAIKAGKHIALANKETLVAGGELVMNEAKKYGVNILPVDSEHGAIFQCLQGNETKSVDRIILTASGGPFRGMNKDDLINVTPEIALKHPKWNMGKKISIDSSTLINKGLEVIEAHWLFGLEYNHIDVIIHPESIIHSMVEYKDGSIIAQLANADMRLPIQYALNYPKRESLIIEKLDFSKINSLTFYEPDKINFRGLQLAYDVGISGGTMPVIFNASNEIAVDLFLNNKIRYLQIIDIIEESLNKFENNPILELETILETDKMVRNFIIDKYAI